MLRDPFHRRGEAADARLGEDDVEVAKRPHGFGRGPAFAVTVR
jgi:hypothetical protein